MKFGLDRLVASRPLRKGLQGKRVALLGHPASVTRDLTHALDALGALPDVELSAAFGPQHGLRGDKQDNMVESPNFTDSAHRIPVFSLYGTVRRPTAAMMSTFDVLLVDLQDVGCRIYTFITTLRYVLEEAARHGKAVWVLDRPNPVGRPIEGLKLRPGWQSFVGAGPLPMRHGLTMGELALWFVATLRLKVDCRVIEMQGWKPEAGPGYGWPLAERAWINPSPNVPMLESARCYPGTVLVEGTTRPFELVGAPDIDPAALIAKMHELEPKWLRGCALRTCWFEPTFQKHVGKLCAGVQIHVEQEQYSHAAFRPWRLQALAFKALRTLEPKYPLWREFAYEYEHDRLAIDLLNGSDLLREWVDNPRSRPKELDDLALADERAWGQERRKFLLY
jgi:uncharacterized protein YbbC (DUF1343 family)